MQTKSEAHLALSEDSLDQTVCALLPNNEKCGPPCYLGDCAWIEIWLRRITNPDDNQRVLLHQLRLDLPVHLDSIPKCSENSALA
jgi:hypothetical protein